MRFHRTPALLPWLFPKIWWKGPRKEKTLYLTFDDGPIPEVTEFVLDELRKYQAKATFFCVGENLDKHPAIAIQVLNAGHLLANHTYHHVKAWHLSPQKYLLEVRHCQAVLENITGEQRTTRLFRPPHGQLTRAHVRMLAPEFQVVMWSSLSYDFDVSLSPEKCLQKTISSIKPGSIVVLHDSLKAERNLRYVLPRLLHHYAGLGYSFNAL